MSYMGTYTIYYTDNEDYYQVNMNTLDFDRVYRDCIYQYTTSRELNNVKNVCVETPSRKEYFDKEQLDKNHPYLRELYDLVTHKITNTSVYFYTIYVFVEQLRKNIDDISAVFIFPDKKFYDASLCPASFVSHSSIEYEKYLLVAVDKDTDIVEFLLTKPDNVLRININN